MSYWDCLDKLVDSSEIIIDRPKGSGHPKYKNLIYPVDYGYLKNTTAIDGGSRIKGVIATVDLKKRDAEIKIMISCSEEEIKKALAFLNSTSFFQAIYIKREN